MATLALSVAGQVVGGMLGGPIGATIGRALGALAGSAVDSMLFAPKAPETPMFDLRLGGSSEGAPIPRLYGWGRLGGNIIWARELLRFERQSAGSKGFGRQEPDEEEILASFAIGLCEGPVARMGRIWADGQLLDTRGLNLRFYSGDEEQLPDSLIEAVQGAGNAPAYRGLCYLVFENLPLSRFGNRIPQLSVELCRVVGELEPAIRAVTVIPGATEFGYDPVPRVRVLGEGEGATENAHLIAGISSWSCPSTSWWRSAPISSTWRWWSAGSVTTCAAASARRCRGSRRRAARWAASAGASRAIIAARCRSCRAMAAARPMAARHLMPRCGRPSPISRRAASR